MRRIQKIIFQLVSINTTNNVEKSNFVKLCAFVPSWQIISYRLVLGILLGLWFTNIPYYSFAQSAQQKLHAEFTADTLSPEQLEAFEKRAVQKLKDFSGFLVVVSNKSYEPVLRRRAAGQAVDLFSDNSSLISFSLNKNFQTYPVSQWMDSLYDSKWKELLLSFSDMKIKDHLTAGGNGVYKGVVSFTMIFGYLPQGAAKNSHPTEYIQKKCEAVIILKKVKKKFGGQLQATFEVWEVLLGDIL